MDEVREWLIQNLGRPLTDHERAAIETYGDCVFAMLYKPSSAFVNQTPYPEEN